MKNLSEQELLQYLHTPRTKYKVTHDELAYPPYEVWGRARQWSYSQALCLFSGLIPLSPGFLHLLLDAKNSLMMRIEWIEFYPATNLHINRLNNFDRLLKNLPQLQKDSPIIPREIIAACKNSVDIAPHLSADLVHIVDEFGPHPSLNLPNDFSQLELNPHHLRNLKLADKRKTTPPIPMHSTSEKHPAPTFPPAPDEPPLEIGLRLFPLKEQHYWEKLDALSAAEILLLHYNINPKICELNPSEPHEDPVTQEFATYLLKYFYGLPQGFLNAIDKNGLRQLLQRSVDADILHMVRPNKFSTVEIVNWMQEKNLAFPIINTPQEQNKISDDEIFKINFTSCPPSKLLNLIARLSSTAIWKQDQHLSLKEVVNHPFSNELRKQWAQLHKDKECAPRTYEDWIRDINPNYRPRQ